jgi:hypothetical protein
VQLPPLHHVPALSANAVFIDLRVVKPSVTTEERNDFLLEDLRVSVDEVSEIWPEPESQLLRLVFFTADQHKRYLDRLTAGVPWSACRGALVYGWSPGDAVTAVRLTGVPASLPDAVIREHFSQFGRVTRVFRSKDKVFTRAANGIAHISIAVAPGFTLPAFVSLVDADGCTDKRMLVHTDASRRRCSRCGTTGHVAQFCRVGRRAAGADAALWSVIRIPADLLPAAEAAMDTVPARPPPPSRRRRLRQQAGRYNTAGCRRRLSDSGQQHNPRLLYTFIARRRLGRWGRCRRQGSRRPRWGGGARHWGGLFSSRRRRQRSGGPGFLYSIILYNARRRLSHWECCRR